MITISKAEAKMIREKFPSAHMVTTVHKTMDKRLKNKPEQTVLVVNDLGLDCAYDVKLD